MTSVSTLQLRQARRAAVERGLPGNLMVDGWARVCEDFDRRCAYCGIKTLYPTIDHFLPLSSGEGGTTITNCVPSCSDCNGAKGASPPEVFLRHDPARLAALRQYLATRPSERGPQPFWPLFEQQSAQKEKRMKSEQTEHTPFVLSSGKELHLYNSPAETILQLRLQAQSDDPGAASYSFGTALTPVECLEIAETLIQHASGKVVARRA
jgi:hypothetical protein